MNKIMQDDRKIETLDFADGISISIVGGTVDEIIPYEENGEMAPVVWFACVKDSEIVSRYNAKYVEGIIYV